jgi:sugar transferase (PEP-CTERM/EpsH1 system associated)
VHGEHGWDVDDIGGTHFKPALLRRLHKPFVDRYITVSKDLAHYLAARIAIPPSRIAQIYNGVDSQRFQPAITKFRTWLPENFQSPRCVIIGTVGRAQAVKDQGTLITAFTALMRNRPDLRHWTRLVIVGDGPNLPALQAQVDALNIADITHVPGARDDIPSVLQSFDAFVLPSLNEGISNTILEAMACGLPVIATGVGGNVELVESEATGSFFQPGDAAALTALLERYASDRALRDAQGASAREIVLQRYSMQAMIEQYMSVYDSLLQFHTQ